MDVKLRSSVGRQPVPESERPLALEADCERDVDLMLVEELESSRAAQELVFSAAYPEYQEWSWEDEDSVTPRHSVPHRDGGVGGRELPTSGETDIEITYRATSPTGEPARLDVLVENKIGERFQPRQPERYLAEALGRVRRGESRDARAVICAPAQYLASSAGARQFHAQISYETLAAAFRDAARVTSSRELAKRYTYREQLLLHAIARYRRSYRQVSHPTVSGFWRSYRAVLSAHPEYGALNMPQPAEEHYDNDVWITLNDAVPKDPAMHVWVTHKLPEGMVELRLNHWGAHRSEVQPKLETMLETGMFVPPPKKPTSSLPIALAVPACIAQKSFRDQQWKAEMGMAAALRLVRWYARNLESLRQLAPPRTIR